MAVLLVWVITRRRRLDREPGERDAIIETEPSKVGISTYVSMRNDSPKRQHGGGAEADKNGSLGTDTKRINILSDRLRATEPSHSVT